MTYTEEEMQLRMSNTMLLMFCRYGLDACKAANAPPEIFNAGLRLFNALNAQMAPKQPDESAYESEEA